MQQSISLKGTLISLIESIDMFNYLLKNHHRRVAIISYSLGLQLGLSNEELKNLVFAASLHDIGALTVEERDKLIEMDVENPRNHEIIGSAMLSAFEPFSEISKIINHHHIKWSEKDSVYKDVDIPKECFILHLADRIDILTNPNIDILIQSSDIISTINSYRATLFAPWCVDAFNELSHKDTFWLDIDFKSFELVLSQLISSDMDILINPFNLESLAYTFAHIIDFRSKFTASHSLGVGNVAYAIGKHANLSKDRCHKIKIAGYLHDIGKIAIPMELIEKKGRLNQEEYEKVKLHTYYTYKILSNIKGLEDICNWASKHHEKYDGSGYPYHISENMFSIEIDIIAYADIFTSLCEDRPYRKGMTKGEILDILETFSKSQLSKEIFQLVKVNFDKLNQIRFKASDETNSFYNISIENLIV